MPDYITKPTADAVTALGNAEEHLSVPEGGDLSVGGAGTFDVYVEVSTSPVTITIPAATSVPRINNGQADGDTLSIDAGGLTLTGYQWQELDGTWGNISSATSAAYDTNGQGHAGKYIRCVTPEGTTPPVHIYMQMSMASHNTDDVALLNLVPHSDATHISVQSGAWDTSSTWLDGNVPGAGARVLIAYEHDVTYDHETFTRLDWLRVDGELNWAIDQSTKILCETMCITRGGSMTCGTPSGRLPSQYTSEFQISNRYYRVDNTAATNLGGGTLSNDPTLVSRGIINQGSRVMWGADKTHWVRTRCQFELSTALTGAAETSVVLTEAIPTSLAASGIFQVVVTDPTDANHLEYIDVTYTSYTGSTLTITSQDFSTLNAPSGSVVYISFAPMAGDTVLTTAEAPTGWAVGDELVIGATAAATDSDNSETEVVTITAISSDHITFTPALVNDHHHQNANVTRADLQPAIGNLTRNIKIYSEDGENIDVHRRGHTMDMHMLCHTDIWDVEHYDLGRTHTDSTAGKIDSNGDFKTPTSSDGVFNTMTLTTNANLQSRYPMHTHFVGYLKDAVDTFNGCTVYRAKKWGIAHHSGEVRLNQNVVYDYQGSGITSETGDETGEWVDNLTVMSRRRTTTDPKTMQGLTGRQGDDNRHGWGYSFRGRAIRNVGNFAMDCSVGHVFSHRQESDSITATRTPPRSALDFGDLQGVQAGGEDMPAFDYPIIHNNDIESAGTLYAGLFVHKADPAQRHGLSINFRNPKLWGCRFRGIEVQYVAKYIIENADVVGTSYSESVGQGVTTGSNAHQISYVNPRTEAFNKGVYADGGTVGTVPRGPYTAAGDPFFALAGLKAVNCTTNFDSSDLTAGEWVEYAITPAEVALTHSIPFELGTVSGSTLASIISETYSDSLTSAGAIRAPLDTLGVTPSGGFYVSYGNEFGRQIVNGSSYLIIPVYLSDRLYGTPYRSIHGYRITSGAGSYTNTRTWSTGANTITVNSGNPISFSVSKNGSQTIDVLALISDTAGATLTLASNPWNTDRVTHWNPGHGRLEWDGDGDITYTPDAGYVGEDRGWIFVDDDLGNSARVDLLMMVS